MCTHVLYCVHNTVDLCTCYTCTHAHTYTVEYTCILMYTYVHMYIIVHVCISYTCATHMCICTGVHAHVHVYMHMCSQYSTCIYVHTFTPQISSVGLRVCIDVCNTINLIFITLYIHPGLKKMAQV